MIISLGKRLSGLCKHRGGDHPTDSRQGQQEGHVTMLVRVSLWRGQFVENRLDALGHLRTLLVDQAKPRQEQQSVFGCGFGRARSQSKTWALEDLTNLPGVPAPNAVVVKELLQTAGGELGGSGWKWREFEETPKPCLVNA